ncbi:aminotransferase class III-fold pyridoxal phosphate-dependent enzyme [Erwiniaceae bacterium BAC15a-03b]|uniref:Aminotransferase class III-fold pyridoxal phosphate-dependent enzyme n=1 Tax=Winslowiella arboricola TaxID=2978220 RepID=A0A9J6PW07_9GAMM|nr:aminotransferase class III-fold pyridoxal phosphate-dependent enzyme [Winslowiella arboricola]MCU5775462.1 aminotransferase class III-fold pyridoxal phosphate-dependent enzyme [Winslowiella arboricola]MCU5779688.1 aminotransferase class III-fold pyridoxal phosphate-dependent enzyme [Winslowiella arboricola]
MNADTATLMQRRAALIARPALLAEFGARTRYFNTFGGNPVSAAVGLAVLQVIEDEQLQQNALTTGAYLMDGLRSIAADYPLIGDVRGAGLYAGLEIVSNPAVKTPDSGMAARLVNQLAENGVLVGASGSHGQVIKVRPPLPFKPADADHFLEILRHTLQTLTSR